MKLTRRKLAASLISAGALAAQQTPTAAPAPAPADSDLKTARDRLAANAAALSATAIPLATEPAFQFKA
ncbi:MAG: hypothetical protein ABI759_22895 [Candidatus Solibacter sp.]